MHSGLLLEQGGSAATSGRTARSAESGAPDAAPGPHRLREAAADCLPGGGSYDSRTWPRPDKWVLRIPTIINEVVIPFLTLFVRPYPFESHSVESSPVSTVEQPSAPWSLVSGK